MIGRVPISVKWAGPSRPAARGLRGELRRYQVGRRSARSTPEPAPPDHRREDQRHDHDDAERVERQQDALLREDAGRDGGDDESERPGRPEQALRGRRATRRRSPTSTRSTSACRRRSVRPKIPTCRTSFRPSRRSQSICTRAC